MIFWVSGFGAVGPSDEGRLRWLPGINFSLPPLSSKEPQVEEECLSLDEDRHSRTLLFWSFRPACSKVCRQNRSHSPSIQRTFYREGDSTVRVSTSWRPCSANRMHGLRFLDCGDTDCPNQQKPSYRAQ